MSFELNTSLIVMIILERKSVGIMIVSKTVSNLVLMTLVDTKGDHIYLVDFALQN